jgi:hypothetical protein
MVELAHPTQQIARRKWISYELFMVNGKWKLPGQPLVKKLSADTQTKYFLRGGISLAVSWWIW